MTAGRFGLTADAEPGRIIAWQAGRRLTVADFQADLAAMAARLPAGSKVLNVCQDRYRFMVGFAATLVRGGVSMLPASQAAETVRRLQAMADGLVCLHDGNGAGIGLPAIEVTTGSAVAATPKWPAIEADRIAAVMLTSGSTGAPLPHAKTWGALVRSGRVEAERLGLLAAGHAIVGTVPVQHSYGFESTMLLAMQGNCSVWSGRPFFPADIAAALAAVPRPRLLVTTPFHLRTLLEAGVDLPALDMVLSATAPLSPELAAEAEHALAAPLHEIYGCTETGQLASRRTVAGAAWWPLAGVRLAQEAGLTYASGGHVAGRQPLADVIELAADGSFLLHGRNADMVNIAGKRTSLAYLDHQLLAIDGVEDGCFFMPDEDAHGITRLVAFAVAPQLAAGQLLAAMRDRIDPVFLPRPLLKVGRLPRNATGKLTRAALLALLAEAGGERR